MIVIGIGHKARHGKGQAAAAIINARGGEYDIRSYELSQALKKEVDEHDAFELCLRYGIQYETNPVMNDPYCTTRHGKQPRLLQFYGQKKREEDPFYWIKKLDERLKADNPQVAIITDMRQWNEFYYVKSLGGFTINCNRIGFRDPGRDPNHITEVQLDNAPYDFKISVEDSEEGLQELRRDAVEVFDQIVASLQVKEVDLNQLEAA